MLPHGPVEQHNLHQLLAHPPPLALSSLLLPPLCFLIEPWPLDVLATAEEEAMVGGAEAADQAGGPGDGRGRGGAWEPLMAPGGVPSVVISVPLSHCDTEVD